MKSTTEASEKVGTSHGERIRDNYDTKNLSAIMDRFYSAVSWRDDE
jgi:hypothetical protein